MDKGNIGGICVPKIIDKIWDFQGVKKHTSERGDIDTQYVRVLC